MASKDARVDAYIERSAPFARPILKRLRALVHRGCPDAEETIKWGFPHFLSDGTILCSMAAFRSHCAFGFWKSSQVLGDRGKPREAMGQFGRIASAADLPADAEVVRLVRRAAALNAAGVRVSRARAKRKPEPALPGDLDQALCRNPKARAAFAEFSPSKRRDYVEWITDAKREETRRRRLETAVAWIAEGKARNWKYERA